MGRKNKKHQKNKRKSKRSNSHDQPAWYETLHGGFYHQAYSQDIDKIALEIFGGKSYTLKKEQKV